MPTGPQGANTDLRRAPFLLSQIGSLVSEMFAAAVEPLGLTPRCASVLRLIGADDKPSQRQLAERLHAPPSRVVALIDHLEATGLVARERGLDRRRHELTLTHEGRAALRLLETVASEHAARVLDPLSASEQQDLARLLVRLADGHGLDLDTHRRTVEPRCRDD